MLANNSIVHEDVRYCNGAGDETYLRSDGGQENVDAPADNVVTPSLVISAIRPLAECIDTFVEAAPLGVGACATLLGRRAKLLD